MVLPVGLGRELWSVIKRDSLFTLGVIEKDLNLIEQPRDQKKGNQRHSNNLKESILRSSKTFEAFTKKNLSQKALVTQRL